MTREGAPAGRLRALRVADGGEGWAHLVTLAETFARLLERRDRGRVDLPRLLHWVRRGEATAYVLARGPRPFALLVLRVLTGGEPAPTLWIEVLYRAPGEPRAAGWLHRLLRLEMRRRRIERVAGESPCAGMWRLAKWRGFRPRAVSFLKEG